MRTVAMAVVLLSSTGTWAEHGSPQLQIKPGTLYPGSRILLWSDNGVDDLLEAVFYGRARLRAYRTHPGWKDVKRPHTIALRLVDRFDDMEGHTKLFDGNAGYGQALLVLAPQKALKSGIEYVLDVRGPKRKGRPQRWVEAPGAAFVANKTRVKRSPRWRGSLVLRRPKGAQGAMAKTIHGAVVVRDADLPLLLEARLRLPGGGKGKSLRLLKVIDPRFHRDLEIERLRKASPKDFPYGKDELLKIICVTLRRHGLGRRGRVQLRLTLISSRGKRAVAPRELRLRWSSARGVRVCLKVHRVP